MRWWNPHSHSHFSTIDGMTTIPSLFAKAHEDEQPALGLMDHGLMSGTVQAYKEAKAYGMKFFPGVEVYLLDPSFEGNLEDAGTQRRYHVGLLALDLKGYQALVKFVSMTHTRPRFSRFPRCTLGDLAALGKEHGKHLAIFTGCYFGLVQQTLVDQNYDQALRVVSMYRDWFPNTFVELQHHNIEHDREGNAVTLDDDALVETLRSMAHDLGLPTVISQDNHYTHKDEKKAHALMKRMVYGGEEDEFPGDSFHLASNKWVRKHYDEKTWIEGLRGLEHLLDLNRLKIPPLDKFQAHVPNMSDMPNSMLRHKCYKELRRYLKRMDLMHLWKQYRKRLDYELGVIAGLGYANYFLYMLDEVNWCRSQHYAVEARGSANGSLVCFLLTLTQVDAVMFETNFERFLSPDRIKPPDVDIDIEHVGRPYVLARLARSRPTVQIGTFSELGAREADQRGSVMATYSQYLRRKCIDAEWEKEKARAERDDRKPVKGPAEDKGKALYRQKFGWIKSLDDVRKHNPKDWVGLKRMAAMGSIYRSYGTHASGVLISGDGMEYSDWVPTMLVASSDTRVSQYNMDDVEEFGMLKGDWLGQKTLTVMKRCQELMGREDPADFTWIPFDDPKAYKALREGRKDNGIFHFEGYTKAKGGQELGIRNLKDVIMAQALYMPGAMESGQKDLYVSRHKSASARKNIKYLHPVFEKALSETYGAVIFQEQPLIVLRELGMDIASINAMFKVVKDSGKGAVERNRVRLAELRDQFDRLALAAGMKEKELDRAWHLTTGFMNYGFNRAHATGYGIRAYRCAYLKVNHTIEFMTALLEVWAGDDKEKLYVAETRRMGVKVLPPDVNVSGHTWTMDKRNHAIRRGLSSIAGIGPAGAMDLAMKAPFSSVDDLAIRVLPKSVSGGQLWQNEGKFGGKMKALLEAGALDELPLHDKKKKRKPRRD